IYQEQKLRPYAGISWAGLDFKQIIKPAEDQPVLSKDFLMGLDAGLLYGYRDFAFRLGINYFPQNKWAYPISRSNMTEIHTPSYSIQLGILYALDVSRKNDKQTIDRWNSYPTLSKQNSDAKTLGDFFIGIGPSSSYSLVKSSFNQEHFPYLKQRLISNPFFELTGGYHFKKAGLFTALSFRNPSFETSGFGAKQIIQKTSLALELNKFLLDYSGFTPYLGLNVAMERMKYTEEVNELRRELNFDTKANMGITLGWDIRPGKNEEALILRTNLRWYPFSSFEVDGSRFNFSQLEYNLIQVILYPGRIRKR
ncbi:MAG: hypothetical protein GY786_09585, partial [Proteobacteria bacterium]|nr:hypothetical protein [Pseudomonadota bacterium]